MSDPLSGISDLYHPPERLDKRTFLQKLAEFLHPGPDSTDELIGTLVDAEHNHLIGADSRRMLEGVIRMADMSAGDVMVPSTRMDVIDINAPQDAIFNAVIDTAHSRFPVFESDRDNIIGILMAKDLLKYQRAQGLHLRTLLRPAVFVPESKDLNDLLRDFQSKHNHLAIVIDEFGRVAGLVTLEDVLEEIVGEIEDEFDHRHNPSDIYSLAGGSYRVNGDTPIDRIEQAFNISLTSTEFDADHFDTIGGLIAHEVGHVPRRGEHHVLSGLDFAVMLTQGSSVKWFKVTPLPHAAP